MENKATLPVTIFIVIFALLIAGCTGHSGEKEIRDMAEFVVKSNASAQYYDNMVESDPGNATAWCFRAMYYNNNFNQYDKALESVNRSIELDPGFGVAWAVKGFILLNSGDEEGAKLCFDNAVKYDPSLIGSVPNLDRYNSGGTKFTAVACKEV